MNRFFLWLEIHQIGILATIILHLFLISVVLLLKINTYTERESDIMISLSDIDMELFAPEEEQLQQGGGGESIKEFVRTVQEYAMRSVPVNVTNEQAIANVDQMIRDIKTEMNITDPVPSNGQTEEYISQSQSQQNRESFENEAQVYEKKFPINEAGERTIYKGPTTVSYELTNRQHVWMPAPVYKCQGRGRIVVNIVVNNRGNVIVAEISKSKSDSQDPCLVEAALRDAQRSRFNETSTDKQQGSITYIFVAQ